MQPVTPMMQQYFNIKKHYKDCLLFYRLGDFYEMFFEDAKIASRELELTLTGRDCGQEERAPMCGVPFHSVDGYIAKLILKGYKVAICEQTEEASPGKTLVNRQVVKVITPGTMMDDNALNLTKNNYLACIYTNNNEIGFAVTDFSTGELYATDFEGDLPAAVHNELMRFGPTEIIACDNTMKNSRLGSILTSLETSYISRYKESLPSISESKNVIISHFKGKTPKFFGIDEKSPAITAIAMLLLFVADTQKTTVDSISHIRDITYYKNSDFMDIDPNTRRSLELTETMRRQSKKGSLLWALDETVSSMGARLLRRIIEKPLMCLKTINERQEAILEFSQNLMMREDARECLKGIRDIERLVSKIVCKSANARDLIAVKLSLNCLPLLVSCLIDVKSLLNSKLLHGIDLMEDIKALLEMGIMEEPPISLRDGQLIKQGFSEELDTLRRAVTDGKGWLMEIERDEKEKTGIKNLKIGFNKVFGYYIEVSNSNTSKVPDYYIRKQTLTNGERYITPRLKEVESAVLGAEEKIVQLEYRLFQEIREKVLENHQRLQNTAASIAMLDVLLSLAFVAVKNNYCRPLVGSDGRIHIEDGRHPVVEKMINEMFVPNDTSLNCEDDRLAIITGPNMAGKSTYMRQVALIALMAQIGSFVPAKNAYIGLVDKLFTRIGASDDLTAGQSTFMVEMSEVSYILKNATKKSLIVFDEIGRGTSTFDGLSIAWSVIEYVADIKNLGARTLFATHYHELTNLEDKLEGVKNYCIAVKERDDEIVFLRKIIKGGADDSYGIEVAKLAGVPKFITDRAKEILKLLEAEEITKEKFTYIPKQEKSKTDTNGLNTQKYEKIAKQLEKLDINTLTPIEAMNMLYSFKKLTEEENGNVD